MPESGCSGRVTLPHSGPRKSKGCFLKILTRVDSEAPHGFGFEGVFRRPGAAVDAAELSLGIVLEYLPGPAYGEPGKRRCDSLYILWRYDAARGVWGELGRATSPSWEWALDLRPMAARALQEAQRQAVGNAQPDLGAVQVRIAALIEQEIRTLEAADRQRIMGVLHDEFAARICT